jgi:hypothetical protein
VVEVGVQCLLVEVSPLNLPRNLLQMKQHYLRMMMPHYLLMTMLRLLPLLPPRPPPLLLQHLPPPLPPRPPPLSQRHLQPLLLQLLVLILLRRFVDKVLRIHYSPMFEIHHY